METNDDKIREIHFYTDITDERQVSPDMVNNVSIDYASAALDFDRAVASLRPSFIVHTTVLSFLRYAWEYIDKGFRVFIHISGDEVIECKEGDGIRYGDDYEEMFMEGMLS